MNLKLCTIIIGILLFQSCCFKKGEEIDRVFYSVEEKGKIPYADDQNVDVITNEGFQFQLNVNVRNGFSSNQDHCEDYTSYEYYNVNLVSNLPTLDIELGLERRYNEIDNVEFIYIAIEINRLLFYYDTGQSLESIDVNGTTYTNVYRYFADFEDSSISEVLFNEAFGILRINYTNGDYVQID